MLKTIFEPQVNQIKQDEVAQEAELAAKQEEENSRLDNLREEVSRIDEVILNLKSLLEKMKFSQKVFNAVSQVAIWHKDQARKDFEGTPYVAHPYSVMLTLSEFTNDEDVLIASLFHDVLEDVDLKLAGIIEKEYGPKVIKIVKALSEDKDPKKQTDAKATWRSRKLGYLEHLRSAPEEVLLISCADKLDNYLALANTIENHGFNIALRNFNAPLKDQLWFADEIIEIFKNRLEGHPLATRLSQTINHIKNLSNAR